MTKLIINDKSDEETRLDTIKSGCWFRLDGKIFISTNVMVELNDCIKVFDLEHGVLCTIARDALVIPIKKVEVNI